MKTKELILKQLNLKGEIRTSDIDKLIDISRQAIAQHFRELIAERKVIKVGSTHNAKYVKYSQANAKSLNKPVLFISKYKIKGLNEDKVFSQAALKIKLSKNLSNNAYKIANYAFTEMLNNAIDHSKSKIVNVKLLCTDGQFEFEVIDRGIGVFENIRKKYKLKDHFESVEQLLKGKQTTDPKHHSGQGIFFTSKIADKFLLESAKLQLIIDSQKNDVFLKDVKYFKGTKVKFTLKQRSTKTLKNLFDRYSGENYEFDKTKVMVHLSENKDNYISRSEAKRFLFGLDNFKHIILDFKGVKSIGQGFADEVFRVYKNSHRAVNIQVINASKSVEFMIKRAKN
ncbi:MAG: DUF4325 domain-containing protein [Candidatus Melainabacteria bacterium]|nr:DUF4325 domain-containing protein [Candidatus Melainabacteria bacterium]